MASNSSNYQVDTITTKKVKKKKETILHPIKRFTVSYLVASDAVEITLGANETFPTGGQIKDGDTAPRVDPGHFLAVAGVQTAAAVV